MTSLEPTHVAAAAVLVTDLRGRTLLLATSYRDDLILPGGMIELDETPAAAAEREVHEETGLAVTVTRLLVIDDKPARPGVPTGLQFVFDTEPIEPGPRLILQESEISAAHWLSEPEAIAGHTSLGQRRLAAAFSARRHATTIYLDRHRRLPDSHPPVIRHSDSSNT